MGLLAIAASSSTAAAWAPLSAPLRAGMVAADHVDASRAGAEVLRRGGNAMDAAAATALALGVVAPAGSGLGGGGFLVYWDQKTQRSYVLDFREVAPKAASRDMFTDAGKAVPLRSRVGGLAVAVPAEPLGLEVAEQRFGKAGLALATQPAERLARRGFSVSPFYSMLAQFMSGKLGTGPIEGLIGPAQHPIAEGTIVRRVALADTLRLIGRKGARPLYHGPLAEGLVATVKRAGGVLTTEDLAAYQPTWREPLVGQYRGHTIYAAPAPAGGLTALAALQILDARPPLKELGQGSSASHHAVAEALKHAFADRARLLGDPAFGKIPQEQLASPAYAKERAALLDAEKVKSIDQYGMPSERGAADPPHDHGTSHLCVVDGEGNIAALTTTVNLPFGSGLIDEKTGLLLNNQMDDFAVQPDAPNAFGLVGGGANAVAPGKRPLSSMTPMILAKDGRPVLCVGGSGGPKIVTATVQTIVNLLDHQLDIAAAIGAPRIHAQWMPNQLFVERDVPVDVQQGLERRGHTVAPMREPAAVQAIHVTPRRLEGASDPRKGGQPAAGDAR